MATIAKTKQPVRMPRFGHRVDKTDPILRGCVGWWPLNDGAGTKAQDLSGYGNRGYFQFPGNVWWTDSRIGDVIAFNGTNGRIVCATYGDSELFPVGQVSVSCWFYITYVHSGRMIGCRTGGLFDGYLLLVSSDGNVKFAAAVDDNASYEWALSTAPIGRWCHAVGVYDGLANNLYIDGVSVSSTSDAGSIHYDGINELWIGNEKKTSSPGYQAPIDGELQNIRIWNRALSATEVSRLYSEPWAGLEPLSPFSFFSVPTAGAPLAVFYNHYKNQGII